MSLLEMFLGTCVAALVLWCLMPFVHAPMKLLNRILLVLDWLEQSKVYGRVVNTSGSFGGWGFGVYYHLAWEALHETKPISFKRRTLSVQLFCWKILLYLETDFFHLVKRTRHVHC